MDIDVVGRVPTPARITAWVVFLLGISACGDAGPPRAERVYTVQDDTTFVTEPFTEIVRAIEVQGGSLIVADMIEGGLIPVDSAGRRGIPFGTRGEGPGEFMQIADVLLLQTDTVAVVDDRLRRLTFLTTDGQVVSQFQLPAALRSGPRQIAGRRLLARAPIEGDQHESGYQLPLVAWSWDAGETDTITTLRHRPLHMVSVVPDQPQFALAIPEPFAPEDAWITMPDARVVVVRATPFQVEVFEGDQATTGPVLEHLSMPVTSEERARFEADTPGSDRWEWPQAKPAFRPDGVVATSMGDEIWVRTWETEPQGEWYDRLVVDTGRIGKVLVPQGRRLLLVVNEDELYTVEVDDVGFQWIRRGSLIPMDP